MASRMGIPVTTVAAAVAVLLAVPVGVYFGELPWVQDLTRAAGSWIELVIWERWRGLRASPRA